MSAFKVLLWHVPLQHLLRLEHYIIMHIRYHRLGSGKDTFKFAPLEVEDHLMKFDI